MFFCFGCKKKKKKKHLGSLNYGSGVVNAGYVEMLNDTGLLSFISAKA